MNTSPREMVLLMLVLASLGGCKAMGSFAANSPTSIFRLASSLFHHKPTPEPPQPAPALVADKSSVAQHAPALDVYKTAVARHVVQSNPEQTFSGKLPPMLPAIVVLRITVDKNGELADLAVQRYRDPQAAWIAVTSMRLSDPLPKPVALLASNSDSVTFLETFLFDSQYRFQLRSLAGPQ